MNALATELRELSTPKRQDAAASVAVFLVALPLCLGIALASGAPLVSGLVAGIVGGVVVGFLSGSQTMVSGPAAGLTAIVAVAVIDLGSFAAFLPAVIIGGVLQVGFGLARLGGITKYTPSSVIRGMLAAIGLILIMKQVPHLIGYDATQMGDEDYDPGAHENTWAATTAALEHVEFGALIIGVLSLALMIGAAHPKLAAWTKKVPAPLVTVVGGTLAHEIIRWTVPGFALAETHMVHLPTDGAGPLWHSLPDPDWREMFGSGPDGKGPFNVKILTVAVTLAIVASLETLLSLEASTKLDPERRGGSANRELVAQGLGNTLSGLLGGIPITGVIVRTAANISAGAKTKWSAILHGVLLVVAVIAFPGLLNRIPLAALAAILLFTGYKLTPPSLWVSAWKAGHAYFIPFAVTVGAILATNLLKGILIGIGFAVLFMVRQQVLANPLRKVSPPGAVLERYELPERVTFLNAQAIAAMLENTPSGARIEIDGRESKSIDQDVLEILSEFKKTAAERGIDYRVVGIAETKIGGAH